MRPIQGTLLVVVGVLSALLVTEVLRATPASAAQVPPVQAVAEQNLDAAGRIQVGLPNVDVGGNLKVSEQNAPAPYQVTLFAFMHSDDFFACADMSVPAGKRLELRYVAIKIESFDWLDNVEAFVRLRTAAPDDFVRDASIPAMLLGLPYPGGSRRKDGTADVLFFKSGDDTSTLQLCIGQRGGLIDASFTGVATGWLHDQ